MPQSGDPTDAGSPLQLKTETQPATMSCVQRERAMRVDLLKLYPSAAPIRSYTS